MTDEEIATAFKCKRCHRMRQPWQVYCGAACCAAWEMGDRDPDAYDSFENVMSSRAKTIKSLDRLVNPPMQRKARFHVLDRDDKRVATLYAETETDAIRLALSEGLDAWSAYDSALRHSGGW